MIKFEKSDEAGGMFIYRRMAEYIVAWLIGLPVTLAYLFFLVQLVVSDWPFLSFLFHGALIAAFPILIVVTNLARFPLINPQWIFTSVRSLRVRPDGTAALRLGMFPVCLKRSFSRNDIEQIVLVRQKHGRGLAFFYYFTFAGVSLYSLYLQTAENKKYYLAVNETQNGRLEEEGRKLAGFLDIPFEK